MPVKRIKLENTHRGFRIRFNNAVPTPRTKDDHANFDTGFPDGEYTDESQMNVAYNYRAALKFALEKGLDPSDLTKDQMKQFEIRQSL